MKKLTKLTQAQKDVMPVHVKKWIAKGLSTEPADFETFERAVKECYKITKLNPNVPIVRVSNPFVGAFASSIANEILKRGAVDGAVSGDVYGAVRDAVGGAVDGAVRDAVSGDVRGAVDGAVYDAVHDAVNGAVHGAVDGAVRDAVSGAVSAVVRGVVDVAVDDDVYGAVRGAVGDAVGSALNGAVDGAIGSAVRDAVRNAVDDAVGGAVHGAVGSAVRDTVRDTKKIGWHYWMGGSLWAGWQAYIDYYLSICNLDLGEDITNRATAYMDAQMSVGYWWPNSRFVMVCDRPDMINLDDNGRLHSQTGMSIRWRDGIGLYFYHGQKVPGWIITNPEKITIKHIQEEENVEVQRCMIELYGVSQYLMDIKATIIDMDTLTLEGSAPRALMQDDKGNRWLIGSDGSTKRVYHMMVSPDIKTCKEAHKLLCGFDESLIMMEC